MDLNIRNIRKKAQGLPLETIVIAVIVVIVLVVIIGIFLGGTSDAGEDSEKIKDAVVDCNKENILLKDITEAKKLSELKTGEKAAISCEKADVTGKWRDSILPGCCVK